MKINPRRSQPFNDYHRQNTILDCLHISYSVALKHSFYMESNVLKTNFDISSQVICKALINWETIKRRRVGMKILINWYAIAMFATLKNQYILVDAFGMNQLEYLECFFDFWPSSTKTFLLIRIPQKNRPPILKSAQHLMYIGWSMAHLVSIYTTNTHKHTHTPPPWYCWYKVDSEKVKIYMSLSFIWKRIHFHLNTFISK